ncbi:MAG: 2,3-bisphosphoglycerate-independent phosphoglycerate mutase [Methanohalophilus sp. T328-1]|jgi:2,3-bisphosphoglycerate-independent phosphoglycerate mutase|uniref:2,3-bisphosphoglycerate-independent phosphoglycerate mutase n=1 Tax=Methanohalophilus euhalobius TaxID=51203 RepID=A0A285FY42_9EURY|nr:MULTISPECIES: cofactor-independent phosphoglycerate mutase [Methanohalophilus]KXS44085.1 MAG: 2,3-bisphosphoglycerate-independent phosphoglycerate mutase [Methanohalophilus sp. T328-1]RSD34737.1 MAG: 2,3-bisphosphoglycerate-independent phosphoglycerate mutase [Methanohalophilus sp.]OBZ34558.1 MAG: cofactor-independent phosphoglycerate mutase [Methanohalophilus sp. DAL1]ODV50316.1 MAG: 2,3-bisphosphoglycerate-independent phosphoglycerate mutase [Methanohalophilus sp. 2-GBenrich]RSD36172.1 MA
MKHIVLIGDGMADYPIRELGDKTVLEAADIPNMDRMALEGINGLATNVPDGMPAGSDVANMSILGYDPAKHYSGRAPLEAASMGIELDKNDVAFRCNLITIENGNILDHSGGHISTEEASQLMQAIEDELGGDVHFYPGISYRHLMVAQFGVEAICTPPHDVIENPASNHMPMRDSAEKLEELIRASWDILSEHPVNKKRIEEGKRPANSIWFWGQGYAPSMPSFEEMYGLKAAVISAVDLIKGLGICGGMDVIEVPGATGYLDTNYVGKAEYALESLKDHDIVFVHVEAPDEAGHMGSLEAKIQAVEDFDSKVVGTILEGIDKMSEECNVLVLPDHPTPIVVRTHTPDPVPFVIYPSFNKDADIVKTYSEDAAADGILSTVRGCDLIHTMLSL